MEDKKVWALLEIHHDSDKGPNDVDFGHKITLHNTEETAKKAMAEARKHVLSLPVAKHNAIAESHSDMIVLQSDDWWKWEIFEVPSAKSVPGPGKKKFTVRHAWVVSKDYEVEAETAEEAIHTMRDKVDSGEVCVWTDGYTATDKERLYISEAENGQV